LLVLAAGCAMTGKKGAALVTVPLSSRIKSLAKIAKAAKNLCDLGGLWERQPLNQPAFAQAAATDLCGSMTNFFGAPLSKSL
jgi:hypothetical protein